MFGIGVCCSRNCMALRGQMRCPPKRLFALVSEQISGSMHWPSFLTCQRGALWLTGHGLRVPGGCRPCNPRKARKGWVDVSELTRNRVQRYAKMAGERERERETFLRVRQSFLFPLGRKTLELTIDACVKPGLWSVAIELMERMQDESVTPETWLILFVVWYRNCLVGWFMSHAGETKWIQMGSWWIKILLSLHHGRYQ